jgi:hypothetical protein
VLEIVFRTRMPPRIRSGCRECSAFHPSLLKQLRMITLPDTLIDRVGTSLDPCRSITCETGMLRLHDCVGFQKSPVGAWENDKQVSRVPNPQNSELSMDRKAQPATPRRATSSHISPLARARKAVRATHDSTCTAKKMKSRSLSVPSVLFSR